ncbi:enhanced intracellular survival protein Eis [Bacillus sp. FJAT-28004]|uniref:GNAT family N-acetyltransferase n=1 Tax=Bacillus sp. FJAT-28004 TaxID=1679165 RepID=UPI0006B52B46|nr:GNAT family N-acetyltransferase [Bacillus sp. FJAT-28004]
METRIVIKHTGMEQFDESMALSQFAFQYERSAAELEQTREQYENEPAVRYGAYVDNQPAAQAAVLKLQTYIGGKAFDMGGIAGVATWPEFRRQGLVAQILIQSLIEMKDMGLTVSFLHPFSFGFYRKFGWETYTEQKAYTIKADMLPERKAYEGRIERVSGNYSILNDVYQAYASQYNGSLVRTELWWKYRISKRKSGQIALYYDKVGAAQGYVIYEVKNSRLTVHEFVHLNEPARAALWSFLAQHDSMIEELTITMPSDDRLPYLLNNPRIKQEIIPYFMARIVDAEAFVGQYDFKAADHADDITIQLIDAQAPWNNGHFLFHIDASGRASLRRKDDSEKIDKAIKLDIGSFTSVLFGYIQLEQLAELARIEGDIGLVKRLQSRIPERTTYLPDFF